MSQIRIGGRGGGGYGGALTKIEGRKLEDVETAHTTHTMSSSSCREKATNEPSRDHQHCFTDTFLVLKISLLQLR